MECNFAIPRDAEVVRLDNRKLTYMCVFENQPQSMYPTMYNSTYRTYNLAVAYTNE
jgi:hypothetical protein